MHIRYCLRLVVVAAAGGGGELVGDFEHKVQAQKAGANYWACKKAEVKKLKGFEMGLG